MEFKGGFREDLKTGLKEDVNILELYKKHLEPELSIILPCRNEEQALPYCLNQIKQVIQKDYVESINLAKNVLNNL